MLERVARNILRYSMFGPGDHVGVGVSGGPDSLCLLHILRELPEPPALTVLHVNHQLRGIDSDRDEEFVRQTAAELGLPFFCELAPIAEAANLEEAARDARRAFFHSFLKAGRLDRIALGHTRSDQAETVLFRFLRGAGTAGLAGMRPVTEQGIVRPLLDTPRPQIEAWLRGRNIAWREDASNQSRAFARNRIRHDLLPSLSRDWNPEIEHTLAQTAEWARGEEEWWEREVTRMAAAHLERRAGAVFFSVGAVAELPDAAARRLVRHAIGLLKGDLRSIGFAHVEALLAMARGQEGHGRIQLPGIDAYRSFDRMRLAPPGLDSLDNRNFRLDLAVPSATKIPGTGQKLHLELSFVNDSVIQQSGGYNGEVSLLDWGMVSGSLQLRNWRPGDQYQPVGHSSEEKLKMLFQRARVPLWERRHWPVIVRGEEILWSRLFGPAATVAAGSETRSVLRVWETAEKE